MLAEDRLNTIVSMVQQAGSVTVPELADALGVTASTIRRDLQTLDRAHRIAKVHGGATSLERAHVTRDLTISERSDLHNDDKERICARAARSWSQALCTSIRVRQRSDSSSIFRISNRSPM